jgi:hypothetical protein
VTDAETQALKKELEASKIEIEMLHLRLANVTLLLKKEMAASGNLPKIDQIPKLGHF